MSSKEPLTSKNDIVFQVASPQDCEAFLPQLAALHHRAVRHGANLGFLLPFPLEEANDFWQGMLPKLVAGKQTLFIAKVQEGIIVGCAVLTPDERATFPQRAEVGKLIVDPLHRRKKIAQRLMQSLEAEAKAQGRWKLVLRTPVGAEREGMYTGWGWQHIGYFPARAMRWDKTCIVDLAGFQKDLRDESAKKSSLSDVAAAMCQASQRDACDMKTATLPNEQYELSIRELANLLMLSVNAGVAAGQASPIDENSASFVWNSRINAVKSGIDTVLLARYADLLVGCAVVKLNSLPVATHRVDVPYLLAHPDYNYKPILTTLLQALGQVVIEQGRWQVNIECQTGSVLDNVLEENPDYYKVGILHDCGITPAGDDLVSITYWVGDLRPGRQ